MANLRKHKTEQLWDILYNVRLRHEDDNDKGGLFGIIANLIIGQQAIIGILNRQKREQERVAGQTIRSGRERYGPISCTINYKYDQPQGPFGNEETANVAHPTERDDHPVKGHGPRGKKVRPL